MRDGNKKHRNFSSLLPLFLVCSYPHCTAVRPLLAILLTFAGCAVPKLPTPELPPMVWRSDLQQGARLWQREAVKRFGPEVFIFSCHGSDGDSGEWECVTEDGRRERVEPIARTLSDLMPTRTILLMVCNPQGRTISVPRGNVYYVRRNLTVNPGSWLPMCDNSIEAFKP